MNDRDSLTSPFYTAPRRHSNPGTLLLRHIGVGILLLVAICWVCTQYVAHRLGYQAALGEPLLTLGGWKLYSPFDWLGWYVRYHGVLSPVLQSSFRIAR
jgi:type IV secretion system protein VirD4